MNYSTHICSIIRSKQRTIFSHIYKMQWIANSVCINDYFTIDASSCPYRNRWGFSFSPPAARVYSYCNDPIKKAPRAMQKALRRVLFLSETRFCRDLCSDPDRQSGHRQLQAGLPEPARCPQRTPVEPACGIKQRILISMPWMKM